MKRKIFKILVAISLIFIILNICLSMVNKVLALSDVTEVPPEFWISGNKDVGEDELIAKAGPVLGIIRAFGMIASIITLAIIGIKIMFGSVEEKATYKQTLIPWGIGAVMLFAMTTIPTLVFNIIGEENMEKGLETSSGTKERTTFCVNGNEMEEASTGDYYCLEPTCQCNGKQAPDDPNYKYKCGNCNNRLIQISNYYWCYGCEQKYEI